MVWHDSPLDEHPPANVTPGMDAVWQIVELGGEGRSLGVHGLFAYLGTIGVDTTKTNDTNRPPNPFPREMRITYYHGPRTGGAHTTLRESDTCPHERRHRARPRTLALP